jgi:hypothetical protein
MTDDKEKELNELSENELNAGSGGVVINPDGKIDRKSTDNRPKMLYGIPPLNMQED